MTDTKIKDECSSTSGSIKVENHIIFLYSDINEQSNMDFNNEFIKVKNKLIQQEIVENRPNTSHIEVRVNSFGGSIINGLSMMDQILNSEIPVITIVDGAVASAASFITVVGKKRYINKHSCMLIHQLSAFSWGNYETLKEQMKNLDYFMDVIRSVYKEYTHIKDTQLDEILKHDLYLSPEKCLEYGLVDEILEPGKKITL